MAWKILLVFGLSISLAGCRNGNVLRDWRETDPSKRVRNGPGRMPMDIGFEISYQRDGAMVAIKGRI